MSRIHHCLERGESSFEVHNHGFDHGHDFTATRELALAAQENPRA